MQNYKIQSSSTENIMKAFLSGKVLKRKHIETDGNALYIDSVKTVYKSSHSKGINIKVSFWNLANLTKACEVDTFNTILSYINNAWKVTTNEDNKKCLIGIKSKVMSNPIDGTEVGFMMLNKRGQQFFNRGIL
jgi:hypothetical protein